MEPTISQNPKKIVWLFQIVEIKFEKNALIRKIHLSTLKK